MGVAERRAAMESRHPKWPHVSIVGYFDRCVDDFANRPLVVTDESSRSYADVAAESRLIAAALSGAGIVAGDRVALLMPNDPILPSLMLGVWRLGAVVVPLNTSYRPGELAYALAQSESAMLIVGWAPEFRTLSAIVAQALGGAAPVRDKYPFLKTVLYCGHESGEDNRASIAGEALEALVAAAAAPRREPSEPAAEPVVDAEAPAVIMYTSGTTGSPKGVILTHDNLLRAAYGEAHHKAFEDGRRAVFSLPMYHAFGLVVGFLAGLPVGGSIVPFVKFDAERILDAIGRHRATFLMAVPTMTVAMLEAELRPDYDFSTLRSIHSSAAATPSWVWDAITERFGAIDVFTSYGMTETTATIACSAPGDSLATVATTVGRVLEAGVAGIAERGGEIAQFRLVSPDTGLSVAEGEVGEICVSTPLATQGYYSKPEETARLFDPDGWLRTGDMGWFREDGYLVLASRLKELYKTGGELVSPKEVEELLTRHPAIAQAFVFGVPDDRWGEAGCAFVVANGNCPTEDEVRAYVKGAVAGFKVPKYVFAIATDDLPRTGTGKIQKFVLREWAIERLTLARSSSATGNGSRAHAG